MSSASTGGWPMRAASRSPIWSSIEISLRTTYRSDVASVIQNNGGNVAGLLGALRQKTGGQ